MVQGPIDPATWQYTYISPAITRLRERAVALAELQEALASVRTLSGLLPICMYCKKIRNDEGYWDRIEKYLGEHTDALLSHGLCPDCYERYALPELEGAEAGPAG